ncbi:MAG: hypothetical protein VZR64_00285 [Eubacterium sp.]|nr:hypothetical protein [Eubacterium sp.]
MSDMIREGLYIHKQECAESLLGLVSDQLGIDQTVLTTSNVVNITSFDITGFNNIELRIGDRDDRDFAVVLELFKLFSNAICIEHISDGKLWYIFHVNFYYEEDDRVISGDIVVRFDNQNFYKKDNAALNLAESEAEHASEYATDCEGYTRHVDGAVGC